MEWRQVNFRMPKEEFEQLEKFIAEATKSSGHRIAQSNVIRNGIRRELDEYNLDKEKWNYSYQSGKLWEMVSDLFQKEFLWKKGD